MKPDFIYYGLKISSDDYNKLTKLLRDNNSTNEVLLNCDKIFIHHCTLMYKNDLSERTIKIKKFYDDEIGRTVPITIVAIGKNDKAMAFKVSLGNIPTVRKNNHITICTMNGGRPVDSNDIVDWKEVLPLKINTKLFCFKA